MIEKRVDVGVERDLAVLEQAKESAREHRLADGPSEEEGRRVDGLR